LVNAFRAPHVIHIISGFLPSPPGSDPLFVPLPSLNDKTTLLATGYDGNPEPKHYLETKTSPDLSNLWEAVCIEFQNMESKKVWQVYPRTDVPSNCKEIGAQWVYARNIDGQYHARYVEKCFSKLPGKDFQENHAPVVSDTTMYI
jgi:mannosyltransferase OCH1-like enzyme